MPLTRFLPPAIVALAAAAATMGFAADIRMGTAFVILIAVLLWASLLVPEYFTSLCFIAAALILQLAPPAVIFSGFSAKAVWLVFAGIVLGTAVQHHHLGASMFQRLGLTRLSYKPLIWTLASFSLALAFVLPSAVGRVLVLAPLVRILCDELGLAERSNERSAICMTVIACTTLPAFAILTSNVPNMVLLGTVETVLGFSFTYPRYFAVNFPVLGACTFVLTTLVILRAFPGRIPAPAPAATTSEGHAYTSTPEQRRLAVILATTLLLWLTEELHTIPAAWVGLSMALACLTPGIGVLEPQAITRLNLGPWFFLAGVIAVGAVARHNGVADLVWQAFSHALPLEHASNFARYIVLFLFNMILGQLTTLPAAPSIFVPLIPPIAETTGWSMQALALASVPSYVYFAFPYQAPPLLIGTGLLAIPARTAMRVLVPVWLIGSFVLVPLHYLWGRTLGVFP